PCRVTPPHRPCIRFLFVASELCFRLPPHPVSRRRSCLPLTVPANRPVKDFHLQHQRHAWHTRKEPPAFASGSGVGLLGSNRGDPMLGPSRKLPLPSGLLLM